MTTATDERAEAPRSAEVSLDELAAEFPGWHIWRSRPTGLWWATRIGDIHYGSPHQFNCTGWAMTVGDVRTLTELRDQLAEQRGLDGPEPLPIADEPPSAQPLRTGSARACDVRRHVWRPRLNRNTRLPSRKDPTMTAIPPMRRRIVGSALRRYREQLGYTLDDAARVLDCDRSKISRIETGQRGIRRRELLELLTEYSADKQEQDVLAMIADTRGAQGWWRPYADVLPDACIDYFALEMAASRILIFGAQQVPDLLQTEQYASAVAEARPGRSSDELQRLTDVRLIRQETVLTECRPDVVVIIGEAALRQAVGGHEVMRAQLASLADVNSKFPEVSIRVLPFARGAHIAGGTGSFTVLRYAEALDLGVVYLAGISGGAFLEEEQDVMAYASAFEQLAVFALSPAASVGLIRQIQAEGQLVE